MENILESSQTTQEMLHRLTVRCVCGFRYYVNSRQVSHAAQCIVVFDLQSLLCKVIDSDDKARNLDPECISVDWCRPNEDTRTYVFAPHVDVLLKYLANKNVRISFFSSEKHDKHESIVHGILSSDRVVAIGNENLKVSSQIKLLSEDSMRPVTPKDSVVPTGKMKKDLSQLLLPGESLKDVILVDDESFTTGDQPEVIKVESCLWSDCSDKAKNNMYYLLGLFTTFFERREAGAASLHLRDFIGQVLPANAQKYRHPSSRLQMDMTLKGLHLVRQSVPEAILYGTEESDLFDDAHSTPLSPKVEQYMHSVDAVQRILGSLYVKRNYNDGNIVAFMRHMRKRGLEYCCKQMYDEEAARLRSYFSTIDNGK